MLARLRARLADETGFALVDAMVGVIAITVVVTMLVGTSVAASNAMTAAASQSERQMYLRSLVNTLALNPDLVGTTVQSSNVTFADKTAILSTLRVDDGADRTVIRAAVNAASSTDCGASLTAVAGTKLNPTCLVAELSVDRRILGPEFNALDATIAQAGAETAAGTPVVQGTIATFTPPSGVTSVKWVVGVEAPAGAGRISLFQSGARVAVAAFDIGADKYLYGTLPVTPAVPLTLDWEGAPGKVHNTLVYTTAP